MVPPAALLRLRPWGRDRGLAPPRALLRTACDGEEAVGWREQRHVVLGHAPYRVAWLRFREARGSLGRMPQHSLVVRDEAAGWAEQRAGEMARTLGKQLCRPSWRWWMPAHFGNGLLPCRLLRGRGDFERRKDRATSHGEVSEVVHSLSTWARLMGDSPWSRFSVVKYRRPLRSLSTGKPAVRSIPQILLGGERSRLRSR